MPEPEPPQPSILPEHERKAGQSRLTGMAVLGAIGDTFIASIAPLFMLALGSTPFYIGLLATTEHLQKAARVVGIRLVSTTGKTRLMAGSRALAVLPVFGLFALSSAESPGDLAVTTALVFIACREFIRQTGNTVWWALIRDNTVGDAFGAFMARLRIRQRAASLVLPIGVGWYLGTTPGHGRFSWLFVAGIITSLIGAYYALGIKESPAVEQTEGAIGQLKQVIRLPPVAWLSAFMACHMFLYASTFAMWVVALKQQGLGAMAFMWMGSVAALGQLVSLTWWGRLVDAHGPRSTLSTTLLIKAALGLSWLLLPTDVVLLHVWCVAFYLLWGVLDGGQNLGRSRAMMDAVSDENQVAGFNAIMYAGSIGGMIGGVLGGWCFGVASDSGVTWMGYPLTLLYLAGAQVLTVFAYAISRKLTGYTDQVPTRDLMRSRLSRSSEIEQDLQ